MKNGELIGEMIAWEEGSPKRINHFPSLPVSS